MNIAERKKLFIEKFQRISNEAQLIQLEELLNSQMHETKSYVAYTTKGEGFTEQAYINRVEEAEASINKGESITHEEMKLRAKSWSK